MTYQGDAKTCKTCCMEIPAGAKKCPYCHHWQHPPATFMSHPLFVMSLFLLFFVVPFFVFSALTAASFRHTFGSGEPFRNYAGQITVAETKPAFGHDQFGPVVVVIGKMKNSSPVEWKDVRFQVDFFNHKGELMDTGQQETYAWRVPEGEEAAFKVSFTRQFPEKEYVSHKVRVISATDGRQRF